MASLMASRLRHPTADQGQPQYLLPTTQYPPQQRRVSSINVRSIWGAVTRFAKYAYTTIREAPTTDNNPTITVPLVTSEKNNRRWMVWKSVFNVAAGGFFAALVYSPYCVFKEPFTILSGVATPAYVLWLTFISVFASLTHSDTKAANLFDLWIFILKMDFVIVLRFIKLLILKVSFTYGFGNFALMVVYGSSLFSTSSIGVLKMVSKNKYPFAITLIDDFMVVIFNPCYDQIFTEHRYIHGIVSLIPIIVGFIARLTEPVFPPSVSDQQKQVERVQSSHFPPSGTAMVQPEREEPLVARDYISHDTFMGRRSRFGPAIRHVESITA